MIRNFVKYYLFWILFFVVQKPLFMLAQHKLLNGVTVADWLRVIWHAFPLDLSVASYVTVVFGLLMVCAYFCPARIIARISTVYTALILLVCVTVFGIDIGVFPYWGFHPDKTLFIYLETPKEMFACAPWWVWVLGFAGIGLMWSGCMAVWRYWMRSQADMERPAKWSQRIGRAVGMLVLTALLFLPIRGSLTTSTMNTGRVYFSGNRILNQCAINPVFNIVESMSVLPFDTQRYTSMPSEEARKLVEDILPRTTGSTEKMLRCTRPNIVFFILESFSSNAWDAMPNLRRLAGEGVCFSNAYASSFRTDRGVVAALSGFPGQPTSSLMLQPSKSRNLPQLSKSLAEEGYALKFWYGGDEDFTNMRSYLISGGFMERVNDHSFPVTDRLTKWGVPDHILFAKAAEEIAHRSDTTPTLDVILSLSSHEPFEVQTANRFDNPYLNSIAYTDSCIGAFVDSLRQTDAWQRTLLVFVADHGYPYPASVQNHEPARYKIPIVWAGGAVAQHRQVPALCSQIDLIPTLLAQMEIDHSPYLFGKNILDTASVPFAFYSFNDGFALLTELDSVVIDAKADCRIIGQNDDMEKHARAFMQCVMEEIERL